MPDLGWKRPRKELPADIYLQRIQTFNTDQERLKAYLFQIVDRAHQSSEPIARFKDVVIDGLLVSGEVLSTPDV